MPSPEELDRQLQTLLDAYEHSLAAELRVDESELIARHPALAPRLAREIRKRRLVHNARLAATTERRDEELSTSRVETTPTDDVAGGETESPRSRLFHDFELLETLGRGGMGIVYKARQISLNRIVAVKMLRLAAIASDEELSRFRAEAEAAARLAHPSIVMVHNVGIAGAGTPAETPYFSMEYVEGQSLQDKIRDAPLDARAAAELIREVADAIEFAHARDVLHRDLKPSNILLDAQGRPRVTDFGLAKRTESDIELTRSGDVIGTPAYMPPEQASAAHGVVGPRSDVYSLGATLYACLTCRPPFAAASRDAVLDLVRNHEPLAPRVINPSIPRDLEVICLKCLEKTPDRRYATAQELADDLRRFLRGESIVARPTSRFERSVRWCRRQPWRAAAVGLAAAAILLVGAIGVGGVIVARRQSQLRSDAELRQRESERHQRLAEVRQTIHSHTLARLRIDARRYVDARKGLLDVPPTVASWDTWRLRHEANMSPELHTVMAAGYWSMIDADLHHASGRLATVDASGLIVIWNIDSGQAARQLTAPRMITRRPGAPPRLAHHFESRETHEDWPRWPEGYFAVRWTSTGDAVIAVTIDGRVDRFHADTGDRTELFRSASPLIAMEMDERRELLLLGEIQGGLSLRQLDGGEMARLARPSSSTNEAPATDAAAMDSVAGEDSTLVSLVSLDQQRWLVGREDGRIHVLDRSLAELGTARVPQPLWNLASDGRDLVAAACAGPFVPLFVLNARGELTAREGGLVLHEVGDGEAPATRAKGTHIVSLAPREQRLFAGDDRGVLHGWELDSGRVFLREQVFHESHPARRLLDAIQGAHPTLRLPPPYRRLFARVVPGRDRGELLVVPDNAKAQVWRLPERSAANIMNFPDSAGTNPRIQFDPIHPEWLWALNESGQLTIFDSISGTRLAVRDVQAQGADVAVSRSGVVLTAGNEPTVGRWTYDAARRDIVLAPLPPLRHDRALLSVAVSPDERWVASVDDQSQLILWDSATGEIRHRDHLSAENSRPATGRVAFNCDSTLAAAFGAGQAAPIYRLKPFAKTGLYLAPSGSGGRALAWSPSERNLVRGVDDYRRVFQTWVGEPGAELWQGIEVSADTPRESCRALKATPDGKRWVQLEEGGRVAFTAHDHLMLLHEMQSSRRLDSDLAFDPSGRRMALAGRNGEIEIWETGGSAEPERAIDEQRSWEVRDIPLGAEVELHIEPRNVRFDPQGRLSILAHQIRDNQPLTLYFLRMEAERSLFEPVEMEGFDKRGGVHFTGATLTWGQSNEPIVAVRRTLPTLGVYEGALLLGNRNESGRWNFETVVPDGNWGHYPHIVLSPEGTPSDLFHFGYDGSFLRRSTRDQGRWRTEVAGDWGSGMALRGATDSKGRTHLVYSPERFPGDRKLAIHALWDQGRLKTETITGRPGVLVESFQLALDDTPYIGRLVEYKLVEIWRREAHQWQQVVELPATRGNFALNFAVGRQGEIHVVELVNDNTRWELRLLTWHQGNWTTRRIRDESRRAAPDHMMPLVDRAGRIHVLVGSLHEPRGWLELISSRAAPPPRTELPP